MHQLINRRDALRTGLLASGGLAVLAQRGTFTPAHDADIVPIANKVGFTNRQFQVGDLVRIETIPAQPQAGSIASNRHYLFQRLCLKKTCRVIIVGKTGRAELDISPHVVPFIPGLLGCSMTFEPQHLSLVERTCCAPTEIRPTLAEN